MDVGASPLGLKIQTGLAENHASAAKYALRGASETRCAEPPSPCVYPSLSFADLPFADLPLQICALRR
jgi:hypothetical protein